MPMTTKYAAPASFSTVNTSAERARTIDTPSAAAATWTTAPLPMPATDARPASRPWSTLRATTYRTDGPGTTRSSSAAGTKTANVDQVGIRRRLGDRPDCEPPVSAGEHDVAG